MICSRFVLYLLRKSRSGVNALGGVVESTVRTGCGGCWCAKRSSVLNSPRATFNAMNSCTKLRIHKGGTVWRRIHSFPPLLAINSLTNQFDIGAIHAVFDWAFSRMPSGACPKLDRHTAQYNGIVQHHFLTKTLAHPAEDFHLVKRNF